LIAVKLRIIYCVEDLNHTGAIQIIHDTFLAYFKPPVTEKCHVTFWLTSSVPHVLFGNSDHTPSLECHVLFEWHLKPIFEALFKPKFLVHVHWTKLSSIFPSFTYSILRHHKFQLFTLHVICPDRKMLKNTSISYFEKAVTKSKFVLKILYKNRELSFIIWNLSCRYLRVGISG